ncbi:MAG: hypothetical protein SP4CHLAM5_03570 [Chlamydiia bacterium]|nr:hypothetical protein [Chlamydiia bacterium]MCH9618231.1 hypothetical protein [Chlamydiia bacterium]MCH9624462.1 hypothetical protein [Chlamydiia bacterium]
MLKVALIAFRKNMFDQGKLVRDKIPSIIFGSTGKKVTVSRLNPDLYRASLHYKLREEVEEVCSSRTDKQWLEEMADVHEVFLSLLKEREISFETLEKVRLEKAERNGSFKDRIFLYQ